MVSILYLSICFKQQFSAARSLSVIVSRTAFRSCPPVWSQVPVRILFAECFWSAAFVGLRKIYSTAIFLELF